MMQKKYKRFIFEIIGFLLMVAVGFIGSGILIEGHNGWVTYVLLIVTAAIGLPISIYNIKGRK